VISARHPFLDRPVPLAFAHRGGCAEGPENTLGSFERAFALGYRYLETDVHVTADGRLVALHDPTLDRVTDRTGPVAALPWSEVRRALVGGREPVPLFEDLLTALPRARWTVDVKAEAALEPLLETVARHDAWDRVCVGSFDERRVARARALAGGRLATSLGTRGVIGVRLRSLRLPAAWSREAVCVQVPEHRHGVRVVDRAFVRTAHRHGLQVHVWTVNEPERMRALLDLGVDGIMTDQLQLLREVLTERGAWRD
jgi:glycerophosphoryl diester phosphodiesterase